jgi:UDP-GlcNAc:undecaprenyl-phosphate/decaprenyl-phosphate GlcNAc-1-phosphate transferase
MEHRAMNALITIPAAALVAIALMPSLTRMARRVGLIDTPGGRKKHIGLVPLAGGIAVYLALLAIGMLAGVMASISAVLFLALAGLVLGAGVVDDFRGLPAWAKLGWQVAVAVLAVVCGGPTIGDPLRLIGLPTGLPAATSVVGPALSVVIYVAVMNAINLFDGADGVAGGVAIAILAGLLLIAAGSGAAVPTLAPITLGAVLGFLYFNMPFGQRHRAPVFLGDAGSMVIGFAIAWFSLELYQAAPHVPSVVFVWLLGLPVLDMVRVALGRLWRGASPFAPGREHLHHLLLACGTSPLATALTISGTALCFAALALAGVVFGIGNAALALAFTFVCVAYSCAVAALRHAAAAASDARPRSVRSGQRPSRLRRAA